MVELSERSKTAVAPIVIDAMQFSHPERARFEEWRRGGIGCVHVTLSIWENARETLSVIGNWHQLFAENGDLIALAVTTAQVRRIAESGRTAVIFGFQNTAALDDDISLVSVFHRLGVRIIQLTYNVQNSVAAGCWEDNDCGLSKHYGRNLIAEMNRLGMLVDISHCSERTGFDAIEASSEPIAITHANPSEFVGTEIELNRRNKSTPQIKLMAERGGVIGLSMYPKIMRGGSDCGLDEFVDMIAWVVERIGIDHVGFGTDFYTGWPESEITWWRAGRWARTSPIPVKGFSAWPSWFQSPVDFPCILEALDKRGFSRGEIAKIAGENWLRLFERIFKE